ncbi:C3H1-type domain-containing protein [Aphelenchoides besseyi]|nr:C3H1-type domain-containing protein [Aphelenchoides besseyi]
MPNRVLLSSLTLSLFVDMCLIVGLKMEMNDKFRAKPSSWKNPALYKSRLCDAWINGRECRFGVHCWFAHGPHELRSLPYLGDNPTAKTISLAQVIQTLPQLSRGRKYAQTANLAFATEFVKSVAPVLNQNMRLSESQNPFTASKHSTPSFNHSMPRNPNPSAVSTFTFSRSNPFAAGL